MILELLCDALSVDSLRMHKINGTNNNFSIRSLFIKHVIMIPHCVCPEVLPLLQQEHWFEKALQEKKGFVIKKMKEDGACLFRAVGGYIINHLMFTQSQKIQYLGHLLAIM